jgi:hypothetical protein
LRSLGREFFHRPERVRAARNRYARAAAAQTEPGAGSTWGQPKNSMQPEQNEHLRKIRR